MSSSIRRATSWAQTSSSTNGLLQNHNSGSAANLLENEQSPFIASMNGIAVPNGSYPQSAYAKSGGRLSWRRLRQRYFAPRTIMTLLFLVLFLCFLLYIGSTAIFLSPLSREDADVAVGGVRPVSPKLAASVLCSTPAYNASYPFTTPEKVNDGWRYRIGLIADQDTKSYSAKDKDWSSLLRFGYLWVSDNFTVVRFEWPETDKIVYRSGFGDHGRGMELSELVVFNGRLYAVDDRTGLVYDMSDYKTAIPWIILMDGNGRVAKGFKSEWATVKDNYLYIGGWGKEWTTLKGEVLNSNPMWIKRVSVDGSVTHHDWSENYRKLRTAMGVSDPGFVIHEAAAWSPVQRKWFFLPRKLSKVKYDEVAELNSGSNVFVAASEKFDEIRVLTVGAVAPTHGFSTFKFVPQTHDTVVVALKTEENGDAMSSYIVVFKMLPDDNNSSTADVIMAETKIDDLYKFEGIEFL